MMIWIKFKIHPDKPKILIFFQISIKTKLIITITIILILMHKNNN